MEQNDVAVFGLGYVGCVTAACLAHLGHRVTGVDRDEFKVQSVLEGRAPFYEPGLEELIVDNVARGRLTATTSAAEGLASAGIVLIAVGTPSTSNGNLGLDQLERVLEQVARHLPARAQPVVVAIRSTVFPGTCESLVSATLGGSANVSVVANPEFLREGSAVADFLEPSLVVVGGSDPEAMRRVAALYGPLGVDPCLVSLRTAEFIKYACNSFHALKVAFANEMGTLCARLCVPADQVMETLCRDVKLNISPAYLKPGMAFGGSCLPKDLRALNYRAVRLDLDLPLLGSILPSNHRHLERAIQAVLDLPAERIGVFGLAFKENTDDLRGSPVVSLIEQLIGKGREVRIFDPHIQMDRIYGTNKNFVLSAIPHIGRLMEPDLDQVLEWAEHMVIAQKPAPELLVRIQGRGRPVLRLTGAMEADSR